MVDLEWHEFYEIGIDFIDAEHKGILSTMRDIQESLIRVDLANVAFLTNNLLVESNNHFKNEEAFLAKVGYPQLEEHSHYHDDLLVQANRIRDICQGMTLENDLVLCVNEMKGFLIDDILYGDVKFKSYLEFKGYIPRKF